VAFAPDGRRFASGGGDGKVHIWNAADRTEIKTFDTGAALTESGGFHEELGGVAAVAFSPSGKMLATAIQRPRITIQVWNFETGQIVTKIERPHGEEVRSLAFTKDDKLLLSSGYRRISRASFGRPFPALTVHIPEIRLWDPATGKRLRELTAKEPEAGFGFSALSGDGKILASEASETIRLWDLASGSTIGAIPNPGWWGSHALAISPDGKTVAAATHCAIGLWDIATGKPRLQDFCGHTGSAVFLAHCPDGAMIVTGSNDGRVMAWDAKSGRRLYQRQLGRAGSLMAMALSPDGRLLAAGGRTDWTNLGSTNTVRLWRTKTGEPVRDFGGPDHPFGNTHRLAFSPDGKLLAIAADFRRRNGSDVDIYETESGKPVAALRPDRAGFRVAALGFAADAKTLYEVCDQPVEFRAWDVKSGKLQRFFVPHLAAQTTSTAGNRQLGISGALFSPDCKWLITCQQEASIVVWSVADGKAVSTVQLPGTDKGRYLGLSRDGRLLAAVEVPFALDMGTGATAICAIDSTTGSIRIWQRDAGRAALAAEAGDGRVLAFAFSPDNKHLATGMDRGTVLVWDLESTEGR
jgi:WD40 repeat protein